MNKRDATQEQQERGFTLIEILLVIGLIAFLAAIVIIAINPARQFAQARNTQRRSDVNTIINAVYQFAVENNGLIPGEIAGPATEICQTGIASTTCNTATLINLSNLTAGERYLTSLPRDPGCPDSCSVSGIGYTVATSTNGRVTVSAPDAELGVTISVTR